MFTSFSNVIQFLFVKVPGVFLFFFVYLCFIRSILRLSGPLLGYNLLSCKLAFHWRWNWVSLLCKAEPLFRTLKLFFHVVVWLDWKCRVELIFGYGKIFFRGRCPIFVQTFVVHHRNLLWLLRVPPCSILVALIDVAIIVIASDPEDLSMLCLLWTSDLSGFLVLYRSSAIHTRCPFFPQL